MKRLIIIFSFLITFLPSLLAQSQKPEFIVYFRQGQSWLDLSYRDNKTATADFIEQVRALSADPDRIVFSVNLKTAVSPDGNAQFNDKVASERTKNVRDYLATKTGLNASQFKITQSGIDWPDLVARVEVDSCAWKTDIRAIALDSSDDEMKCAMLKDIDGGRCWQWLLDGVFQQMRSVTGYAKIIDIQSLDRNTVKDTLVMVHKYENKKDRESGDTVVISRRDTVYSVAAVRRQNKPEKTHYWKNDDEFRVPVAAIRTNLLLPLLNVGVEIPLGNRFSVAADIYYPFIPRQLYNSVSPANKTCFQMLGGYLEGRCYLGSAHRYDDKNRKYRLRGHHLNVVFGGCYYDYEANWKGRQGEAFALGFGYGYTLPLGKGGVMMEFDVNIGAIYNITHPYTVYEKDGWLIRDTNDKYETVMTEKGFILGYPVKAGISLVIPIHENRKPKQRLFNFN